jgi:heat-inducible transcriptional repressor
VAQAELTERQRRILELVVAGHLDDGRPVGSRAIAEQPDVDWAPSTVRSELAALEAKGFLTHPHTSAGRVPTDSGYRFYADQLLERRESRRSGVGTGLELTRARREIDDAMRETTAALSRVTDLLALVTAPPPSTARIHRVEVLRLQPRVVVVIVIASTGAVTKRVFAFDRDVDSGLVEWAGSYLNERLTGLGFGARMIRDRLQDPGLSAAELAFLDELAGAFTGLDEGGEDMLYIEGTARLLSTEHTADLPEVEQLMGALERRAALLTMLRSALDQRSVFLWIGAENPEPRLRSVSVVGANYGLGYRNLGSVGVVGPLRMDYATAIGAVREAAVELSRFFETVYER